MKDVFWIGSSLKDLQAMPDEVKDEIGYALYLAQKGKKHVSAKPLQGFGGAGVLEVVERHDGDTFRAVYTVKFESAVYVLSCFQKKSKSGNKTPQQDLERIKNRLKTAREEHEKWLEKKKS